MRIEVIKKVIEQTIYVPELENGLVKMDMNIIEYPLFTKNRTIKPNVRVRFVINDNRNKTIEIIPAQMKLFLESLKKQFL